MSLVPDLWHPFTQLRDFAPLGTVVGAHGPWLHLQDGRRVLDGISSWWVNIHGHAHPHIASAIARQAAAFDQVILADFAHAPATALTAALVGALQPGLTRVFFSDDGSTAVEAGLKMAWQAVRAREPRRHRLVAFQGSYHGDTLGAMSVGARDVYAARFTGLLQDVHFLPWDDPAGLTWLAEHGDTVVAVIIEPMVQCAGGMRLCRPAFLRAVAEATRAAGALLLADEVAVGFGRTGRMWACEHAGIVPDLLALSKGITGGALPLGATACTEEVFTSFLGADRREAFLHGHSYTGNPLACAAALASLELFGREHTLQRVAAQSSVYAEHTPTFAALPQVAGVRHLGAIFAFEVQGGPGGYHDPVGARLQRAAFERGLYLRPLGNTVYLMPPAATAPEQLDAALRSLLEVVVEVVVQEGSGP